MDRGFELTIEFELPQRGFRSQTFRGPEGLSYPLKLSCLDDFLVDWRFTWSEDLGYHNNPHVLTNVLGRLESYD